ncbi:MAG: hypothetical protein RL711_40 [Bacteroidota bacterium]
MTNLLIIVFVISLIYMASAGRLLTYTRVLFIQGILLSVIALLELTHDISVSNLIFIVLETVIFKAIVVPFYFSRLIVKNKMGNERESDNPNFFAIFKVALIIMLAYALSYNLNDEHLHITYFTAAISAIFVGLLMIVRRKKIITHIMGYMVLENGIFLLSMALGSELPLIVNLGILLDLFTSVLLFGLFITKIDELYHSTEIDKLSGLRD